MSKFLKENFNEEMNSFSTNYSFSFISNHKGSSSSFLDATYVSASITTDYASTTSDDDGKEDVKDFAASHAFIIIGIDP